MKKAIFTILVALVVLPVSVNAQWNQALHFTWQEHDRVIVPDAPQLFPPFLNAGTVEMWFKPDTLLKSDTHDPDFTYLFSKNISGNNEGDLGLAWQRLTSSSWSRAPTFRSYRASSTGVSGIQRRRASAALSSCP